MANRLATIVRSFGDDGNPEESLDWVCAACASELELSGAAVALVPTDHEVGPIGASDERASMLVDI